MNQRVISFEDYLSCCAWGLGNDELRKELLSLNTKQIKFDWLKNEVTIYYET